MVPRRDRIDVWWNLATGLRRTKTRTDKTSARFSLDGADNLIDVISEAEWLTASRLLPTAFCFPQARRAERL